MFTLSLFRVVKPETANYVRYSGLIDVEGVGSAAVKTELELVHQSWRKNMQQLDGPHLPEQK